METSDNFLAITQLVSSGDRIETHIAGARVHSFKHYSFKHLLDI